MSSPESILVSYEETPTAFIQGVFEKQGFILLIKLIYVYYIKKNVQNNLKSKTGRNVSIYSKLGKKDCKKLLKNC